jgi:cardiolipin synthase
MKITWGELYTASEWLIRIAMLFYVPYRRDAASARVWLLLIFFLPWLGLPLYAIFGRAYLPERRLARQKTIYEASERIAPTQPLITSLFRKNSPKQLWPALDLTDALSKFPIVGGNHFELITHYHEAIERLIADIDGARIIGI